LSYNLHRGGKGGWEHMHNKLYDRRNINGYVWMTDGVSQTLTSKEEADILSRHGYFKGRLFVPCKGSVWVSKDGKSYRIPEDNLTKYLEEGYTKQFIYDSSDRIWLNDGLRN